MSRRQTYLILLLCGLLPWVDACTRKDPAPATQPEQNAPQHTFTQKGALREMMIMPEDVQFPEGPGKTEFVSYCGICHSLRYVTIQPEFPRETWEAEVHKMAEKYGAPIDSVNSIKIVDYLMMIRGAK